MSAEWHAPVRDTRELRPYTGSSETLTEADLLFFERVYEINQLTARRYIRRGDDGCYLLPMLNPDRVLRGMVLRTPWAGSPLAEGKHRAWPKADTYSERVGEPVQSFYVRRVIASPEIIYVSGGPVIVVEDQLSAIKAYDCGYNAVAMLGVPNSERSDSYSGQDRVAEIARFAGKRTVVVAFDADATAQSFAFARKWGNAFHTLRVAILSQDIKDTRRAEIPGILGVTRER